MREILFSLTLAAALVPALAAQGADGPERLWQAARAGDVEQVRELLRAGVPVDAATEFGCTALYFAANANRAAVIRALLAAGAQVDVADSSYGFSAIAMAGWLGHTEAVEVLLTAGADRGQAIGAFFAAVGNGHAGVAELYLRRGLVPPQTLDAALGTALSSGHEEVAELLRDAGATPPAAEPQGGEEPPPAAETEAAAEAVAEALDDRLDAPRPVAEPRPWPEFRGPGRSGIADGQHPPVTWDLEEGRNVRWTAAVEGLGHSSPVIWGGRVFITTAVSATAEQSIDDRGRGWIAAVDESEEYRWEIHAYDLASGALEWKRVVRTALPRGRRHWKASQANPSCATDGEVVIASFGPEGLYAFDFDGEPLWSAELGRLRVGWYVDETFEWGYASSPILDGERVIVQCDAAGEAYVAAFDRRTGRRLWRTEREELPSWGTPVVWRGGERPELVLSASKAIVGYDPESGEELWRIRGNSPITVASPIAGDGLIVATGGYRTPKPIYVVEGGAKGDVTPPPGEGAGAVLWSSETEGAYVPTPLIYRGVLYVLKNNGVLTAYDPRSGEQQWRQRLPGRYTASPVAADGRIYFTSEGGEVTVIAAGPEFRRLARNELGAATLATPAISDGTLVLRTVHGLIAVAHDAPAADEPAP